jgi:hypothetical protein
MHKLFWFSFIFFSSQLLSQKNSFEGNLLLSKTQVIPYTLEIEIDSTYAVFGHSVHGNERSSLSYFIEGKFDPSNNSIFYKELDNNAIHDDCPVFVQARVSHLIQDIYVIAGVYVSSESSNCAPGHINVLNRNFKFNLYNKVAAENDVQNDSLNRLALNKILQKNVDETKKFKDVTAEEDVEIRSTYEEIDLKIYDQLKIDRDKVRIRFNNKLIKELELTAATQDFKLQLQKGLNTLEIEAVNEGSIPMNTSKFEVITKENSMYYTNLLRTGQKATYLIKYE